MQLSVQFHYQMLGIVFCVCRQLTSFMQLSSVRMSEMVWYNTCKCSYFDIP